MKQDQPNIDLIFCTAIELASPEERAAYLERACAGDAGFKYRVEKLLVAHFRAGSFLDAPAMVRTINMPNEPSLATTPGTVIGPYKLLQQIGEGGMGVVYMAEQTQPVQRRVALKLIKPGIDSRQVIARFEAERQALALMDHPHIARVFDAGTTDAGQPYFVMELVHGVPLTDFCDQQRLTLRQRLELFVPVCQAVQHAHQKGIIHRDLKPSNVLVALYDGKPVPKVIDFGVAKATGSKLTDKTMFTEFGSIVGTLEYMSPEQAERSQLDVDTRSDIYSLGVMLYELLTGTTPLDKKRLKSAAFLELLRMIKEEEPQKPSTRLSTTDELPSIAANRSLEPNKLSGLVRGELDWIAMKALDKDRGRRYETANGFAADIGRFLSDEPVQACPPTSAYRFRKFARRNRVAFSTGALILSALVLGTVVSTWQALRATQAEQVAEASRLGESKQRKFAEEERNAANLARAAEAQQRQVAEENARRARQAVDEYFTTVSENSLFDMPGLQSVRIELLEKAVRYYQDVDEKNSNDPSVLVGLALAQLRLGHVYHLVDRNDDCSKMVLAGLDVVDRLRREYPNGTEYHRKLAGFFKGYRPTQRTTGFPNDPAAAHRMLTKLIDLWEKFTQEIPDEPGFQIGLAATYSLLGALEGARQKHDEAIATFHKAVTLMEARLRQSPKDPLARAILAMSYSELAAHLDLANRRGAEEPNDRALALLEELATEFPQASQYKADLASCLTFRGRMFASQGRKQEASVAFRRSVELINDLAGQYPGVKAYSQTQAVNFHGLRPLLIEADQPKEAEKVFRQMIDVLSKLSAADPNEPTFRSQLADCLTDLAVALTVSGQPIEAENAVRGAIAHGQWLADNFPRQKQYRGQLSNAHHQLAVLHQTAQRPLEALVEFRDALEITERLAVDFPDAAVAWEMVGHRTRYMAFQLISLNRHSEAEAAFAHALQAFDRARKMPDAMVELDVYHTGDTHHRMAELILHQERPQETEKQYRRAVDVYCTLPAPFFTDQDRRWNVSNGISCLVGFLQSAKRPDDAVSVLQQSIDFYIRLSAEIPADPTFRQQMTARAAEVSRVWMAAERYLEAAEALTRAIELRNQLAADFPGQAPASGDLGVACRKLASLFAHQTNQQRNAEKMHQYDVGVFKTLSNEFRDSPAWRQQLAHAHRQWAFDLWETGRTPEADKAFREAIDVLEKAANEYPNAMPSHHSLLSETYRVLVRLQATTGDAQESEQAIRELILRLVQHAAQDPGEHAYRRVVALAQNGLGVLFKTHGRVHEAEQAYSLACEMLQKLTADFPEVTQYRDDLILSDCDLGDLLQSIGRHPEAQTAYARAVGLNPTAPAVWFRRSAAYGAMGQWELAAADISKLVMEDPKNAVGHNNLAWLLATCPEVKLRDPKRAVELAKRALELAPNDGGHWNTLGVAQYRAADWPATVEALTKSMELRAGGDAFDWFFLAMAHWQLDHKEEARKWFDQAIRRMDKNQSQGEELLRFRSEAAELLGIANPQPAKTESKSQIPTDK